MSRAHPDGTVQDLVRDIDALLPQTQCTRCGYPTCRDYATAIATGGAGINRCPPGGEQGIAALAGLLGRAATALDPACGQEEPPALAVIDEAVCIGCTKCIQACPVDAIVGAGKHMHTVIAAECNGCALCLPACPVDCIDLGPTRAAPLERDEVLDRAAGYRLRFERRRQRLAATGGRLGPPPRADREEHIERDLRAPLTRAEVLAAIARGKARRAGRAGEP